MFFSKYFLSIFSQLFSLSLYLILYFKETHLFDLSFNDVAEIEFSNGSIDTYCKQSYLNIDFPNLKYQLFNGNYNLFDLKTIKFPLNLPVLIRFKFHSDKEDCNIRFFIKQNDFIVYEDVYNNTTKSSKTISSEFLKQYSSYYLFEENVEINFLDNNINEKISFIENELLINKSKIYVIGNIYTFEQKTFIIVIIALIILLFPFLFNFYCNFITKIIFKLFNNYYVKTIFEILFKEEIEYIEMK